MLLAWASLGISGCTHLINPLFAQNAKILGPAFPEFSSIADTGERSIDPNQ
jgi:hypothetical protein